MADIVERMKVFASDGERLGSVGKVDGPRFQLLRDGHTQVTIFPWQVRAVTPRGVELWLARAELPPPVPVAERGVDMWGNRIHQPDRQPVVTVDEYEKWRQSH